MRSLTKNTLVAALFATVAACGEAPEAALPLPGQGLTFEQFRASVFQEADTGIFIVDGDTPVVGEAALRSFYDQLSAQARGVGVRSQGLAVHRVNNADAVWSAADRVNLRYCVSTSFGANYAAVKSAMATATAAWSAATGEGVRFIYDGSQDSSCAGSNSAVTFDVRPVSGQRYLARAFFPTDARAERNILIDSSSFAAGLPYTLAGILRHEIGHTIGLRHEHTRPEAGTCFEDSNWRALTDYDSASVMHYPQCNGTQTGDLVLTEKDKAGARALYPAPFATTVAQLQGRWFRLTNMFLGRDRSLDSGTSTVHMAPSGNYSGQYWKITSIGGNVYRLSNLFQGAGRSLDTYGNSPNDPFLGVTGAYTGQYWTLTPDANGCFRLTNQFLGAGRSLDTYSNGSNAPFMGQTGGYTGQCWRPILL